jgi:hypothetical protein
VVCTYASKEGIGGVLMPDDNVISYESWKRKTHEENYAPHDLQFIVIVHDLSI